MEEFKDIPGYEGFYQVSNLGRVRSVDRKVPHSRGGLQLKKGKVLAPQLVGNYYKVNLTQNKVFKNFRIHQLVAMAFLGHVPCGYKVVVDHINMDTFDNRLENIRVTSSRENTSWVRGTSKYVGVFWLKKDKKWVSAIRINGKIVRLGRFLVEEEAHEAYQKVLKELKN